MARVLQASLALLACAGVAAVLLSSGPDDTKSRSVAATSLNGIRDSEAAESFPEPAANGSHALAKSPTDAVAAASASADPGPSAGAPSDAEVRRDLRRLERYEKQARAGGTIERGARGQAVAPAAAPQPIADAIAGGNEIATFPYRLGGGHASFVDDAYDCSGSVSYALAAAGLVAVPLTSGDFMRWGAAGRGRWLTVYANSGHVFMTVGGLRFDTSGRSGRRGSRWQRLQRSARGFVARHWPGL
jgi:cell wall-associated NlpC family hydrolase